MSFEEGVCKRCGKTTLITSNGRLCQDCLNNRVRNYLTTLTTTNRPPWAEVVSSKSVTALAALAGAMEVMDRLAKKVPEKDVIELRSSLLKAVSALKELTHLSEAALHPEEECDAECPVTQRLAEIEAARRVEPAETPEACLDETEDEQTSS